MPGPLKFPDDVGSAPGAAGAIALQRGGTECHGENCANIRDRLLQLGPPDYGGLDALKQNPPDSFSYEVAGTADAGGFG